VELDLPQDDDSGLVWPSYVDFLTTFIFILLLLVGAMLYLASGDIEEQEFRSRMAAYSTLLNNLGIPNYIEGTKQVISLKDKVVFPSGVSDVASIDRNYLNEVGAYIAHRTDCKGIIIQGFADKLPVKSDREFGNWALSAERAKQVLRYLYLCEECSYTDTSRQEVRAKLRLAGQGDIAADQAKLDNPSDRRVDIILECGKDNAH
jgi:hypothetical protein